jgi:hypothetical protein
VTLHRVGGHPHPCDPWTGLVPAVAEHLFPGGLDASLPTLRRRLDRLGSWKRDAGWTPYEGAELKRRVHASQGMAAANAMEQILSGAPVVLTGQQPVLGGGPLFVWLKALSAIRHAERMTRSLGVTVRAVFWVAGDDSDLPEVRHLSDPVQGHLWDGFPGRIPGPMPVGALSLPDPQGLAASIQSSWPSSFLPSLVASSTDISGLFVSCLHHWFRDQIVVVDAGWPELRTLARSTYSRFADRTESVQESVARGMAAASGAGLPVTLGAASGRSRLFHWDETGRHRINLRDGAAVDGTSWSVPVRDFASAVERTPTEFSHDAGSRPFAAEEIFPVLAHVLGPGEFAYFACLGDLGRTMNRTLAPALPRASITVLSAGPWEDARAAGWSPDQGGATAWSGLEMALRKHFVPEWTIWSRRWKDARADYLDEIGWKPDDPVRLALDRGLARREAAALKERIRQGSRAHEDRIRRLRDFWSLCGSGKAQERILSPWALEHHLAQPELLIRLGEAVDPDEPTHVVWEAK